MPPRPDLAQRVASARTALEIRQSYSDDIRSQTVALHDAVVYALRQAGSSGLEDFVTNEHVVINQPISKFNVKVLLALEAALREGLDEMGISDAVVGRAFTVD